MILRKIKGFKEFKEIKEIKEMNNVQIIFSRTEPKFITEHGNI